MGRAGIDWHWEVIVQNQDWDNILHLLAIAVLADRRVRDPELIEFCHEAQRICRAYYPDKIMPRADLRDWFLARQDALKAKLSSDNANSVILSAVQSIPEGPLRATILQAIFSISICDYDLDDKESALVHLCQREWNIPLPDLELA